MSDSDEEKSDDARDADSAQDDGDSDYLEHKQVSAK